MVHTSCMAGEEVRGVRQSAMGDSRSAEGNEFLESREAELPLNSVFRLQGIQVDLHHVPCKALRRKRRK